LTELLDPEPQATVSELAAVCGSGLKKTADQYDQDRSLKGSKIHAGDWDYIKRSAHNSSQQSTPCPI